MPKIKVPCLSRSKTSFKWPSQIAKQKYGSFCRGYISLHRLIAETKIGRFLKKNEIVHHIDHDDRNNHWDNLEVMTQSQHMKLHIHDKRKNNANL